MSCCTKNNTKEKVKDEKKSCDTAEKENLKAASGEHSAEECSDGSCKVHHGEDSEQKSGEDGCC